MENKTPAFKETMNAMVGLATLASLLGMTPDDLLKTGSAKPTVQSKPAEADKTFEAFEKSFAKIADVIENPTTPIAKKAREDVAALLDICFNAGSSVFVRDLLPSKYPSWWGDFDAAYRGIPHTYVCVRNVLGKEQEAVAVLAEGDTFIRDVGRAIALRRALGMAIPPEFLKAGRPQEKAERWVRRPAKVGETIRILHDRANSADVNKGDTFTVRLASGNAVTVGGLMPWIFNHTNYEVLDV